MQPVHAKSALFYAAIAISLDHIRNPVGLNCDGSTVSAPSGETSSASHYGLTRSRCVKGRFPAVVPEKSATKIEILTVETRGRVGARQALTPPCSARPPKNKSTLSCNFKCHPQAPASGACRRVSPLTFAPSRCELQAPEAILGLLHRGAKGVAVVTRLFRPDLESGFAWSMRPCGKLFKP